MPDRAARERLEFQDSAILGFMVNIHTLIKLRVIFRLLYPREKKKLHFPPYETLK